MSSQAYKDFLDAIDEVNRFFDSHRQLSPQKPGRRALGHITGGCVVVLCASWEQYIKNVMIISVNFLQTAGWDTSPTKLPKSVQDSINEILKNNRDFKPLELLENSWCEFYDTDAKKAINDFHSQKAEFVVGFFRKYIGIDPNELLNSWSVDKNRGAKSRINQIVEVRNRIVHTGLKKGDYPQLHTVWQYKVDIMKTVRDTDNFLHEKLKSFYPDGRVPWKRTTKLTKRENNLLDYKG